jgi:hypothetical protein
MPAPRQAQSARRARPEPNRTIILYGNWPAGVFGDDDGTVGVASSALGIDDLDVGGRAGMVGEVGQIQRLMRQLGGGIGRAHGLVGAADLFDSNPNIGARLSQKPVVLRTRLGEQGFTFALLPHANAAFDKREAEHQKCLPAGFRHGEALGVLEERLKLTIQHWRIVGPTVLSDLLGRNGARPGRKHVLTTTGSLFKIRTAIRQADIVERVHRLVLRQQNAKSLARSCQRSKAGGKLRLVGRQLLRGSDLVDSVANATGEPGVGVVIVRTIRLHRASVDIDLALLRNDEQIGARNRGGECPANILAAGLAAGDVHG